MIGLTDDSKERKDTPIFGGFVAYFPNAMAEVARLSKVGNDKHNPGQPLHWSFHLSNDHADCIIRHQAFFDQIDTDGLLHATKVAWRAMAQLETLLIAAGATPGKNVDMTKGAPKPYNYGKGVHASVTEMVSALEAIGPEAKIEVLNTGTMCRHNNLGNEERSYDGGKSWHSPIPAVVTVPSLPAGAVVEIRHDGMKIIRHVPSVGIQAADGGDLGDSDAKARMGWS